LSKEGDVTEFNSIDEVLDFAISEEEKAAAFYTDLAEKMSGEPVKPVLLGFAAEEQGHKAKLLEVKNGNIPLFPKEKIQDLKIADYLVSMESDTIDDYQKALVLAMQKEKAAFRLYNDLADRTDDEQLKSVFLGLAQEEAKHKLRFETEYDERFFEEN
jgi:rubrerythrin